MAHLQGLISTNQQGMALPLKPLLRCAFCTEILGHPGRSKPEVKSRRQIVFRVGLFFPFQNEEVFVFYWFHMTRQALFKML